MALSEGVMLKIKVQPKSSRNEIIGLEGDYLKIKVIAPPIEGEANKAVINLLVKKLKIPKSQIAIISGHKSKLKTIYLSGINQQEVEKTEWTAKKH